MRSVLTFVCVFICLTSFSQEDSTVVEKPVISPQIVVKLPVGELVDLGGISVQVKRIIDSRCPLNVDCVWAGNVIAVVDIYRNGKLVEEKELNFSARDEALDALFDNDTTRVLGHSVTPYPKAGEKIAQEDYKLYLTIHKEN